MNVFFNQKKPEELNPQAFKSYSDLDGTEFEPHFRVFEDFK